MAEVLMMLLWWACAQDETAAPAPTETAAPTPEGCTVADGRVTGIVLDDASGDLLPVPMATLYLRSPGGDLLESQAGPDGTFDLSLDAGAWGLRAESPDGCATDQETSVDVHACGEVEVTLRMDIWVG